MIFAILICSYFSNKTQQEQYNELFEILVKMRKEQQLQSQSQSQ